MTRAARRQVNNRNYYERHRDAIRERRRARYWKQREAILAGLVERKRSRRRRT